MHLIQPGFTYSACGPFTKNKNESKNLKETDKKTSGSGIKNENIAKNKLAEELQKPIVRKFKKNKVHSTFIDNIWGADLADAELISKFNQKKFFFIMCY